MAAFKDAYRRLDARIKLFVSLPLKKLDRMALKRETAQIGKVNGPMVAENEKTR